MFIGRKLVDVCGFDFVARFMFEVTVSVVEGSRNS